MAGTKEGGAKTAKTNKERYGADYYRKMGQRGGKLGHTGGFGSKKIGADGLTGLERSKVAGAKGGRMSTRLGVKNGEGTTPRRKKREN